MVRPERFELPASWFVARRSIQLSYGRARGANITTSISERHSDAIWRVKNTPAKLRVSNPWLILYGYMAEREGLLGASRLAPSGPP
jgi:hypothetical protein